MQGKLQVTANLQCNPDLLNCLASRVSLSSFNSLHTVCLTLLIDPITNSSLTVACINKLKSRISARMPVFKRTQVVSLTGTGPDNVSLQGNEGMMTRTEW